MGIFSCNSEHSIIACDPYNWTTKNTHTHNNKKNSSNKKKSNSKPKPKSRKSQKLHAPINGPGPIRRFDYADLELGTNGFSPESFLGKGSHGRVYRAVLEQGSLVVAVKKTSRRYVNVNGNCNSDDYDDCDDEIEILSRIRSPRIVNLLGFSSDRRGNRLIVSEFMENGSLFDALHSESRRPPRWAKRFRWAFQIAEAIETLHSSNPPVIHRDIKSSNILIDANLDARLGDFGLALRGDAEEVRVRGTPPAGTLGYIDPGYVAPENLSSKSDVFSFGILLLEIISGRNAIDLNYSPSSVVDWALPKIKHGEFMEICDGRIGAPPRRGVSLVRKLGVLAARCVSSVAEKRPGMGEVVECLRVANKAASTLSSPSPFSLLRKMKKELVVASTFDTLLNDSSEGTINCSPRHGITNTFYLKNRRRVTNSNYSLKEHTSSIVGGRVRRSNSVGSAFEIGLCYDQLGRRGDGMKKGVTVRMPSVKLGRSRSLDNQGGYVFQLVRRSDELKQSSRNILLNKEEFKTSDEEL